jgi:hypothetical protein
MKTTFDFLTRRAPLLGALLLAAAAQATPTSGLDPNVKIFFEEHCYDCHDATTQKGDFRMDTLSTQVGVENTPQWLEVMEADEGRIRLRLVCLSSADPRAAVYQRIKQTDWTLLEFHQETESLEAIFRELTKEN